MKIKIGEECEVTSSRRCHLSERTVSGVPFYCSKEIILKFAGETVQQNDFISEELYDEIKDKYGVPQTNDLLITTRGSIGIPYLYKEDDRFYFADGNLTWLKNFSNHLSSHYLYYWFQSPNGKYTVDTLAKGTAQKALSILGLKNLAINVPEITVQNKIASILSAYDALIENNQKQISLLEEAASRLYKEWFVDLHFPGYEHTKIVDGVPAGWKWKKLSDIANIIMGQSPSSEHFNNNKEGLPFHQGVGSYGKRFVRNDIYSTKYTRIADQGSILFSVRAPVGRLNVTKDKVVIGRGIAALTEISGMQSFLFYMLKNAFFRDDILGNGSVFNSINKKQLEDFLILMPADSLVEKYNYVSKSIDDKIQIIDNQLILLQEARNRLLPKLMSGEVEV